MNKENLIFQRLIEIYGSRSGIMKAMKISRQAVHQWSQKIPSSRAYEIEQKTKGKITAGEILSASQGRK